MNQERELLIHEIGREPASAADRPSKIKTSLTLIDFRCYCDFHLFKIIKTKVERLQQTNSVPSE